MVSRVYILSKFRCSRVICGVYIKLIKSRICKAFRNFVGKAETFDPQGLKSKSAQSTGIKQRNPITQEEGIPNKRKDFTNRNSAMNFQNIKEKIKRAVTE